MSSSTWDIINIALQNVVNAVVLTANLGVLGFSIFRGLSGRKELAVTLFLCFADSTYALANAYSMARRLYIYLFLDPTIIVNNLYCMKQFYSFLILYSFPYTGFADFIFSIDKLIMVKYPFFYREIPVRRFYYVFLGITLLFCGTTLWIAIEWFNMDPYETTILCSSDYMPSRFQLPSVWAQLALTTLSVVAYVPVLIYIVRARLGGLSRRKAHERKGVRLAIRGGTIVLAVLISYVIPDSIRVFFLPFFLHYQTLFFNLMTVKPLVNIYFAATIIRSLNEEDRKVATKNISMSTQRDSKNLAGQIN